MMKAILTLWTLVKVATAVLFLSWCLLHLRKLDSYLGISLPASGGARFVVRSLGVIFLFAGSLLVLICGTILSTRGILETPGDRLYPKEFTIAGPFRYTRNPMSLGLVVFTLGLGFQASSLSILLLALFLFLLLHVLVICVEEPGLEQRFGESYRAYKRTVSRWLPSLRTTRP